MHQKYIPERASHSTHKTSLALHIKFQIFRTLPISLTSHLRRLAYYLTKPDWPGTLLASTSKTISNAEYHLFSIDGSTVFKLISI